jgi:N-methylhydantoinase A/oxoprolinase/acetone carboxylase beta subunit
LVSFISIKIFRYSSSLSFPDHELRVGEIARDMGFTNVSLSHQIIAMQKYVPRAHTGKKIFQSIEYRLSSSLY